MLGCPPCQDVALLCPQVWRGCRCRCRGRGEPLRAGKCRCPLPWRAEEADAAAGGGNVPRVSQVPVPECHGCHRFCFRHLGKERGEGTAE